MAVVIMVTMWKNHHEYYQPYSLQGVQLFFFMSILLKVSSRSSEKKMEWKDMDAITRQRVLVKLTSQLSLSMELVTGCIVLQ